MGHRRNTNNNSDEHYTPKWLFDELGIQFDLDVASPIGGSHVPCKKFYTQIDNGLEKPWFGNIWMNPPYSNPTPWVERFLEHRNGIAILVTSRSKWFHKLWMSDAYMTPAPRVLKFERPNEKPKIIAFQTFLWAFGDENIKALEKLGKVR